MSPMLGSTTTNEQSFTYIIYRRGSETVAQKYSGGIYPGGGTNPIHNTRPEEVIKSVLYDPGPADDPNGIRSGPGQIYIRDGLYQLSNSFSGFDLRSNTALTLGPQAVLRTPTGYSGHVFRLQSNRSRPISNCTIDGGIIVEANPPMRRWTGILLHGVGDGVLFKFMNTTIYNAGIGVQIKATSDQLLPTDPNYGIRGGWINGNSFEFLKMWRNNVFIDFVMDGAYRAGTQITGIHRNRFINLECQSGPNTIHGIRNIRHFGNAFVGVNVWDIGTGGSRAIISNVDQQATGTIIISGIMTGQNFVNRGINTKIIDELNSRI